MSFVAIVLDVGSHMIDDDVSGVSSLMHGVRIVKGLIQKKILSEAKDEVAIFLSGSHETAHGLDGSNGYQHILMIRSLGPCSWSMLEELREQDSRYGAHQGDLLEAIVVAADHLVMKLRGRKVTGTKTIMVISNLDNNIDFSQLSKICEGLKKEDLELNVVSDRDFYEDTDDFQNYDDDGPSTSEGSRPTEPGKKWSARKESNEKELSKMISLLNGATYSFQDVLVSLSFFETKSSAPRGWKAHLEISNVCAISVVGYLKVKQAAPPMLKLRYGGDISLDIERRTSYHLNDGNDTRVELQDTIKGFKYGQSLVPFSDEDIRAMELSVVKGLKLIGFCDEEDISRHLLVGDSSMIFVADSPLTESAFSSLVQAMYECHVVAMVRRVYSSSSSPRLAIMSPRIKKKSTSLVYCEIAFGEDIRSNTFPSLPRFIPTSDVITESRKTNMTSPALSEAHLEAVDSLIDSLMLVKKDEAGETEMYEPSSIMNPSTQSMYQCFIHRSQNPHSRLPPLQDRVLSTLYPPSENKEAVKQSTDVIKSLFLVKNKDTKVKKEKPNLGDVSENIGSLKKRRLDPEPVVPTALGDVLLSSRVVEVGPLRPVEDFQALLAQGDISLALTSMQTRIWQLIKDSYMTTLFPGAISCLQEMRRQVLKYSETDPNLTKLFNDFLKDLKQRILLSPSQVAFWNLIKKENISLIGHPESESGCLDVDNDTFLASKGVEDFSDELDLDEMDTLFEDM